MKADLVRRLEQIDGNWCFDVVRVDVAAGEVLVFGRLAMKGTYRTAFGSCGVDGRSLADAANVAADSALENAAVHFGVRVGGETRALPQESSERHRPDDMPEPVNRITSRQLAAIHAVARRRGVSLPELGAIVRERTGKDAPQNLTKKEASALLDAWSSENGTA